MANRGQVLSRYRGASGRTTSVCCRSNAMSSEYPAHSTAEPARHKTSRGDRTSTTVVNLESSPSRNATAAVAAS